MPVVPTLVCLVLAACLLVPAATAEQDPDWTTTEFERSDGQRTPRYAETVAYCQRLAEASPLVTYREFGTSPQGRGLPLVIVDRHGRSDPEEVLDGDQVVLLVQACIHAGESCGKDAGLMLLRDLTVKARDQSLLEHLTILFIPIFNVDGHERFGPYNRINQNGPEQMGWRVTSRNLNLNRDYLKADTGEMQAWLRLFHSWRPHFFVDVHSTDGADYQYPITYAMEVRGSMDRAVTDWTRRYVDAMQDGLAEAGILMFPYVAFRNWHDPRSGLRTWSAPPRLSQGYTALHDVPGLLIETHMLKDYPTRVEAAYELLRQTIFYLNAEHLELRRTLAAAAERRSSPGYRKDELALAFETADDSVLVDFLGIDYEVVRSELTGGDWFRYGGQPVTMRLPFFERQRPRLTVRLPEAYILGPEWTEVIDRLQLHGVQLRRLSEPATLAVHSYRFAEASWQEQPYEGHHPVSFELEPIQETRVYPAGSVVVDVRQPAVKVAAHILEPEAPDSFAYWGFFDAVMNRVEYVESYVIEEMAARMVADDPRLGEELARKKAADPDFAANPQAIRDWFYRRTPYYDDRFNVYPVGRVVDREVLAGLEFTVGSVTRQPAPRRAGGKEGPEGWGAGRSRRERLRSRR